MTDSTFGQADPNVVLRGGPLDGQRVHVAAWVPIRLAADGASAVYRPTSELDTEFPTLAIWVFDRTDPA